VSGKKVVWHVTDSRIQFVRDTSEWDGTDIVFEIARRGDKTEIRFTHIGLVREREPSQLYREWQGAAQPGRASPESGQGSRRRATRARFAEVSR